MLQREEKERQTGWWPTDPEREVSLLVSEKRCIRVGAEPK